MDLRRREAHDASVGERLLVHAEHRVHRNVDWVDPPDDTNSAGPGPGVSGTTTWCCCGRKGPGSSVVDDE